VTSGSGPIARLLLERGTSELEQAGLDDPRFQSELLLRHALGWTREFFLAHLGDAVPAETTGHFFQLLTKRSSRVPLQYLTGTQEFYGHDFRVTPAVLIPRPETEHLVEEVVAERNDVPPGPIVDVGCGSGCVAVSLALQEPATRLIAIDQSPAALAIARENAVRHGVADRIEFVESDLLDGSGLDAVSIVVSNPPYIPDGDIASLEPEVAEHEPRQALAGGVDGLDIIRRLAAQASSVLVPGGALALEIGAGQHDAVLSIVSSAGLEHRRTVPDLAAIPRVVIARKP